MHKRGSQARLFIVDNIAVAPASYHSVVERFIRKAVILHMSSV